MNTPTKLTAGVLVLAGLLAISYMMGRSVGRDEMLREKIKADALQVERDSLARDSIARSIIPKIKEADRAYDRAVRTRDRVSVKDSTHIIVSRPATTITDSVTHEPILIPRDTTITVLPAVTERFRADSIALELEHNLRVALQKQVVADSAMINSQRQEIIDLKKLKNKPGVVTDALKGAAVGAAVGGGFGGGPGILIGGGAGALLSAAIHVVFQR